MSVALLVAFKSKRANLYVSIAAEGSYSRYWIETGEKLGLRWIPIFDIGTSLSRKEVFEVLEELTQLRWAFAKRNDEVGEWLLSRLDGLAKALSALDWSDVEDVYIG